MSAAVQDTLGWVHVRRGTPNTAIAPLERSVELEPANATYHYHLGLAYSGTGRNAQARTALERALALDSTFDGAIDARLTLEQLGN
jgi:Flp pilus assembly protein TadD